MFDGKSLCEEDKGVLPLKKDKYLSEEHSSGIGGSSCMSSPQHSVSDSDEGDSGQTTASTVQYSVLASSYKGQTPSHQPPAVRSLRVHSAAAGLRGASGPPQREPVQELVLQTRPRAGAGVRGDLLSGAGGGGRLPSPRTHPPPDLSYMPQKSGYRPQ